MSKPRVTPLVYGLLIVSLMTFARVMSASAEDAPRLKITTKRNDDRVTVKVDKGRTIFDIHSPFGISNAIIERTESEWPKGVLLRLHLKGLEHYQVTAGELVIAGSAPSRPQREPLVDRKDGAVKDERPLEATVRMINENGEPASELPLKSGYFEIELSVKLLESNPKSLRVEWVDFYRN